ncbi:MAG: prolipoprotein diacylglyceryl transferase [Bacillales bacterium]|jgi:phosphatidylglycerol:prolipoprotein diacylglycerol transferase|nr:prolipoprotein diacylglyceryl transferase [Bacillales bacterium]
MNIQPLDSVAFSIGPVSVHWYGLIIASAVVIGIFMATSEGKKHGIHPDTFVDLLIWAIPIAVLSARAYYVIFEWSRFQDNPLDAFKIWEGGLAIHGALIGAIITAYIFTKKHQINFWRIVDIAAPSIILGQAMGRWGNFFNQEAFGGEVSRQFLENLQLPKFIINQMYVEGAYHHPTFLYESIWSILGIVLIYIVRSKNPRLGETFLSYVVWYSIGRFFIEGMRTDSLMLFGILRQAQLISVLLIVASIALIIYRRKTGTSSERYYKAI